TAAWTLATRARNAVMLVRGKPGDQLPRSGRELAAAAYALGYPAAGEPRAGASPLAYRADGDPGVFLDDYRRTARRARTIVERVFYGWESPSNHGASPLPAPPPPPRARAGALP